jgi:glycosyltransferase involved in cell wall biosynthesis
MTPTLLPLLVARFHTGRLIAAVHVAAAHYSPSGLRRLRWLARWWCDRFVCVSHTTARGIFGSLNAESPGSGRVAVLPNALDMTEVEAAPVRDWRGELGLPLTARIAGYVGRLAQNKGVDVLIRAAALLHPANPELHWVIVGDGVDRRELKALVNELGVVSVIHFVGAVTRSEVFAAFKGFEVAVVPSREEGFGLSALEAMACGIPLVASRVDALREVVLEGVTGLLFEAEDGADLANKAMILFADTTIYQNLKNSAISHVLNNYDKHVRIAEMKKLVSWNYGK